MAAYPVEWVLVVFYNQSAHRATYGRLSGTKYTKDYIQLSRKEDFLRSVASVFPPVEGMESVPLIFKWLGGTTKGAYVYQSADRPHLKWETREGAPKVWKMFPEPSAESVETIPGNPSHAESAAADREFELLSSRGAGQPYLLAIKLRNEANILHLRAYLDNPSAELAWANLQQLPNSILDLVAETSGRFATACSTFESSGEWPDSRVEDALSEIASSEKPAVLASRLDGDTGRALAAYLRSTCRGIFFDPDINHQAWLEPAPLPEAVQSSLQDILLALDACFLPTPDGDAAAEIAEVDPEEFKAFQQQIESRSYEVQDATSTVKTRGSAQKAFAEAVKSNYGMRCAITGITTRAFLVAAHIVRWSDDQTIRLDPANGICLSLLVDRAFESGYLIIEDNYSVRIDFNRIGGDSSLRNLLEPYNHTKLNLPTDGAPKIDYLQRRRELIKQLK